MIYTLLKKQKKTIKPIQFNNYINLQNIYFKYEDESDYVLKNLNIKNKKGNWVGIWVQSGSGKSTLAILFLGC